MTTAAGIFVRKVAAALCFYFYFTEFDNHKESPSSNVIDNLRATFSSSFNVRRALRVCQHAPMRARPAARLMLGGSWNERGL